LRSAGENTPKALEWLRAHKAGDAYGRALAALAGASRLSEQAWVTDATVFYSRGLSGRIETTALAAQALLRQQEYAAAHRAIDGLLAMRDGQGRFGTTQSTVQALRALLAARSDTKPGPTRLSVLARGGEVIGSLEVEREARRLSLGTSREVMVRTDESLRFTLTKTTVEPWHPMPNRRGRLEMSVQYPLEVLAVRKTYRVRASVVNRADAPARQVTLLVGVPPGCEVEHKGVKGAQSVERADRAVVIYLDDLKPGERRSFEIPFSPRYMLDVKTAPSRAYEYYTPEEAAIVAPARVRTH